ncbi:AMP-binding protein [Sphingobium chlorophenolicum]|uniref:AMP-binding protein n=1 Tax=Sphingobium chlorophenolicum TaxID=46429 RepID=UPI0001E54995|nr:AMP-binding protein [Sphingobium chlorophenolicum]
MGMLWDRAGQTTLLQVLQDALARVPDRLCFDCAGHKASYADIDRQSNGLAHGLATLGVGRGDMVSLTLKPGASLSERELCLWCMDRVPHFAVPRYIELRTDLPRNSVGHVLKFELRAAGVTAETWDRAASNITVSRFT